jgi:hypothetical protein
MYKHFYFVVVICLLLMATPAFAVDDFYGPSGSGSVTAKHTAHRGSGKSKWEESYSQQIDAQAFMERLYTVLTSPEYMGQVKEVAQAAEYMKGMGLFNLAGMDSGYTISGDEMSMWSSCKYADLDPQSYYGKLLALPNGKLASAKVVGAGDYLVYLAMNNVPQVLMAEVDELNKAQALGGAEGQDALGQLLNQADMGDMMQVLGMLKALKLDETMLKALSGELAIVLYGVPAIDKLQSGNIQPEDLDLCIMLGLNDPTFITGLIEQFGGQGGMQKIEAPAGWTGYNTSFQPSVGMVYNDDLLVISPNIKSTLGHLAQAKGRSLKVPECQCYFDLNCTALQTGVLEPLTGLAVKELGEIQLPTAAMSYLVDLPAPDKMGALTMMTSYDGDTFSSEMHASKALGQYLTYYLGVGLCAAGQVAMQQHAQEQTPASAPEAQEIAPEAAAGCACGGAGCDDCPKQADGTCPKTDGGKCDSCPQGGKK